MSRAALSTTALALACVLASTLAGAAAASQLQASDKAKLHLVSSKGEELYETGAATGTLPGSMRVHMQLGPMFNGTFTIDARGGSITGRGRAKPHAGYVYESFAGTLVVIGGTGRYRDAHGTARLYGTFDRDNYALAIHTSGTLRY